LWKEKVYTELWEIYGTRTPQSTPIKYEHLQHTNYLDRVIKETLRIFPTIPIFSRQLTEDLKMGMYDGMGMSITIYYKYLLQIQICSYYMNVIIV